MRWLVLAAVLSGCLPPLENRVFPEDANHDWDEDGFTENGGDCDDENGDIHPGATEVCDGVDNDCNGATDDDEPDDLETLDLLTFDQDGDGWGGVNAGTKRGCLASPPWVLQGGDCDDQNEKIHPEADEYCNDIDDDCDTAVDEDPVDPTDWYPDGDGDLYGDETATAVAQCDPPQPSWVDAGTDCNDDDATVHPGAPEYNTDEVDSDCDGTADAACGFATWKVGTADAAYDSITAAIEDTVNVCDGEVIEVHHKGPDENSILLDRPLTLRGWEDIALVGNGSDPLLTVRDGRVESLGLTKGAPGLVIDDPSGLGVDVEIVGVEVAGGTGDWGGGVRVEGAHTVVTLREVELKQNTATACGGDLYVEGAEVWVIDSNIHMGTADTGAGVCARVGASLHMRGTRVHDNLANTGGGLYVEGADVVVLDSEVDGNSAQGAGGAYLDVLGGVLVEVSFFDNEATESTLASQLHGQGGTLDIERLDVRSGTGGDSAVAFADYVAVEVRNAVVAGNDGTGLSIRAPSGSSTATVRNATVVSNRGTDGIFVLAQPSGPVTLEDVVVGDQAVGIHNEDPANPVTLSYVLFWQNDHQYCDDPCVEYDDTHPNSVVYGYINWQFFHPDIEPPTLWDLHTKYGGELIDQGNPDASHDDPDGTRNDLGAYGGPSADFSYYEDADGDNMWDGWEAKYGLDPTDPGDAHEDPDLDGWDNAFEFAYGLLPNTADSDGDGCPEGPGGEGAPHDPNVCG